VSRIERQSASADRERGRFRSGWIPWIALFLSLPLLAGAAGIASADDPMPAPAKLVAEDLTARVNKDNLTASDPMDLQTLAVYNLQKALIEARTTEQAKRSATQAAVYGWALFLKAGGSIDAFERIPTSKGGGLFVSTLDKKKELATLFDLYLEGFLIGLVGLADRTLGKPEQPEWALVAWAVRQIERRFRLDPFLAKAPYAPIFAPYGQSWYYLRAVMRLRGIAPEMEINPENLKKYAEAGSSAFWRTLIAAEMGWDTQKEDKLLGGYFFREYLKIAPDLKAKYRLVPLPLFYGGATPQENERIVEDMARKVLAGQ
jgi:hypothetical protein